MSDVAWRRRVEPRLVFVRLTTEDDDGAHMVEVRLDRLDDIDEFGAEDQQFGLAVVDDVGQFGRCEAVVQYRVGRSGQGARQCRLDAGRVILVQERDPVTGRQPECRLCCGVTPHTVRQLLPCPRLVPESQGDSGGILRYPVGDRVEDMVDG